MVFNIKTYFICYNTFLAGQSQNIVAAAPVVEYIRVYVCVCLSVWPLHQKLLTKIKARQKVFFFLSFFYFFFQLLFSRETADKGSSELLN